MTKTKKLNVQIQLSLQLSKANKTVSERNDK